MNLPRSLRFATVAVIACAGLGTGISTPAMAFSPVTTLSSGPVKKVVKLTWKECWSKSYANARDSGSSIPSASNEADLTCGRSPDEF